MDNLSETEGKIQAAFCKWTERLGLRWWTVDCCYYDDPAEIVKHFRDAGDEIVLARTYANWMYATATIEINLPPFRDLDDEAIERVVVHELIHILVNEMREDEIHHEERVVTQLTKAIFWVDQYAREEATS